MFAPKKIHAVVLLAIFSLIFALSPIPTHATLIFKAPSPENNNNALPRPLVESIEVALGPDYQPMEYPTSQQAKLLASDKASNDQFGYSVSLSDNGNTALVGVIYKDETGATDCGDAYVFIRSGTTWSQQAKLTAGDKAAGDKFGWSVALSGDGNTALVGAYSEDDSGTTDSGAAYVFTRSGSVWTQQAKLLASDKASDDWFGYSIALNLDGNTALVGAYNEDDSGTTDNGAVYAFTRSGTTWTQQAKLLVGDKANADSFGSSVALSDNGNTALIGMANDDDSGLTNNGAVYAFTRSGTIWSQQAKLLASDKATDDQFGYSISVSSDGNTALIGAVSDDDGALIDNGAAYVFTRSGSVWTQQAKLLASDRSNTDSFGVSVAISSDGLTAIIGAYFESDSGTTSNGAVYVYTRSGSVWTQRNKLLASDKATGDQFGFSVATNSDGNTALSGAIDEDDTGTTSNGAAYVFIGSNPTPTPTNTPVPRTDTIGVYRASNQTYYLRNTNTTGSPNTTVQYGYLCNGSVCNYPVVGDWNGDAVDTIGLYDQLQGVFLLRDANTPGAPNYSFVLGNPNDQPLAGRWTSDMTHDGVGVFRPSNGVLYLKKQLTTGFSDYFAIMGNPGDVGVAGDWNDDGLDSVGVYRPTQSRFYLTNNNQPSGITFSDLDFLYGDGAQDKPFVGDWTGDGASKPGVFRNGTVMLRNSVTGGAPDLTFSFGAAGDRPLAGKWVAPSNPPISGIISNSQTGSGFDNIMDGNRGD